MDERLLREWVRATLLLEAGVEHQEHALVELILSTVKSNNGQPIIVEAGGVRQLIAWHPRDISSLDPETGIFYIYSKTEISNMALVSNPERSNMDYIMGFARPPAGSPRRGFGFGGPNIDGLPVIKPPYGRITAIDLNVGEIVWQVAHGETPDNIKNHPLLEGIDVPRTGVANARIGTLVTKTLVVSGDPGMFTDGEGERRSALRAYDKATGEEVGAVPIPVPTTGVPMTYMLDSEQYIVAAIAGGGFAGELWAFKAPE